MERQRFTRVGTLLLWVTTAIQRAVLRWGWVTPAQLHSSGSNLYDGLIRETINGVSCAPAIVRRRCKHWIE